MEKEQTVRIPETDIKEAVLSDQFAYKPGTRVNIVDASGQTVSVPAEQVKQAFEQGYRPEMSYEKSVRDYVNENDNLSGKAKVALGELANEFAFGVPEIVADEVGNPLEVAKYKALREKHTDANIIGTGAGIVGSLLYGGPVIKGATKAGNIAAKSAAEFLASKGIKRGSQKIAQDIVARSATTAARLGAEGVVVSAPRSAAEASMALYNFYNGEDEKAIRNAQAAAESIIVGGGFGLILGGAGGVLGSVAKKAKDQVAKMITPAGMQTKSAFKGAKGENLVPDPTQVGDGTLVGDMAATGADESILGKLQKDFGKLKQDAPEITESLRRISEKSGVPLELLEEQVSDSRTVQEFGQALADSVTLPGLNRRAKIEAQYNAMENVIDDVIATSSGAASRAEVGAQFKAKIATEAKDIIKKEGDIFKQLRMEYETIPVDLKPLKQMTQNISRDFGKEIDNETLSMVKNIVNNLETGSVQNLNDLFTLRTKLGEQTVGQNLTKTRVAREMIERLNQQEAKIIDRAIERRIKQASVPGQATLEDAVKLQGLYDDMKAARGRWRELAETLEESGEALGFTNIRNPREFVRRIENMSAEMLTKKLLPKQDVARLSKLKEIYPEAFDAVTGLEKAILANKFTKDGKIDVKQFANFAKGMRVEKPEYLKALFGEENFDTINDIIRVSETLKNFNPSGTAKMSEKIAAITGLVSPTGLIENIQAGAAAAGLRNIVRIDPLLQIDDVVVKTRSRLDKAISGLDKILSAKPTKAISSAKSLSAISQLIDSDGKSKEELFKDFQDKVSNAYVNGDGVASFLGDQLDGLREGGAPKVAGLISEKLSQNLAYIYNQMPKQTQISSPFYDPKYKPSDTELSKFERKLSVAVDPFVVIDALEDDSLTIDHMQALEAMYPTIYSAIVNRITDHFTSSKKTIPYNKRIKMSLLMRSSLDPSLTPQALMNFQATSKNTEVLKEDTGLNLDGLVNSELANANATDMQRLET